MALFKNKEFMKNRSILTIFLLAFSSTVFYFVIYFRIAQVAMIYWLMPIWGVILFIRFNLLKLNKSKLIVLFHVIVLLCGVFSFVTYQLFKKLISITPIQSPNFTNVNSLIFNSENALYLMIYGGFLILIFDSIYFLSRLKK